VHKRGGASLACPAAKAMLVDLIVAGPKVMGATAMLVARR
jgi:hypothetical protein